MKNGTLLSTLFITLLLAFSFDCFALSESEAVNDTVKLTPVIEAEGIKYVPPKYPISAAKKKQEGWVRLSYVVDEAGNVKDVLLHDSSGIRAFEREAIKAVKKWQFSPATRDGKPVEQCDSMVQLDFKLTSNNKGVSRQFNSRYKKLRKALDTNDLEEAEEIFVQFKERVKKNFAETIHFSVLSSLYYDAKNNIPELITELQAINRNGHQYISEASYVSLTSKLYVILVQQNRMSEALYAYDNLVQHYPDSPHLQGLNAQHNKVQAFLEKTDSLVVDGKIEGGKTWFHQLYFSKFDLFSEKSPLHRIELRCNNKRTTYGNVSQKSFVIPESWGRCMMYIDGPDDTEFKIAEHRT